MITKKELHEAEMKLTAIIDDGDITIEREDVINCFTDLISKMEDCKRTRGLKWEQW